MIKNDGEGVAVWGRFVAGMRRVGHTGGMARSVRTGLVSVAMLAYAGGASANPPARVIDKGEYTERLHGMFLAECMANWTGIKTEGRREQPPFHTDADWGTNPYPDRPWIQLGFVTDQNPWYADDDTDIEYVYLHLLTQHAPVTRLTPDQIRDGWMLHCNHDIWVSNATARRLMDLGARPPGTAFAQAMVAPFAPQCEMIDAQLTTEFFGALAPGMPGVALEIGDLPVRTTACSHAAHASQFYIVLYSLATQVDRTLPPAEQSLWLAREARKFIPDTSKAADIADFVIADYLANPDKDNWELTRDRIHDRYRANAAANGFVYRAWYESSVNFACGVMALLYGEMDLRKTVRIGTLSGWDSDNCTATLGGLLGLVLGYQGVIDAMPEWQIAAPTDRFWISRTRDNLPDYLPMDNGAEDTLGMMAARCVPIIDRVIEEAGGRVSGTEWLLAPGGAGDGLTHAAALGLSPTARETARSANIRTSAAGGSVAGGSNVPGGPPPGYGSWYVPLITTGYPYDFRGQEIAANWRDQYSTLRAVGTPAVQWLSVQYPGAVEVHTVRFVEGAHFNTPGEAYPGGWFETMAIEALVNGAWTAVSATPSAALDAGEPFQVIDFVLSQPVQATGVRVTGTAGGAPGFTFVTCGALDALSAPVEPDRPGFDVNGSGSCDAEDVYAWFASPRDLDGDGAAGAADVGSVVRAARWTEAAGVSAR